MLNILKALSKLLMTLCKFVFTFNVQVYTNNFEIYVNFEIMFRFCATIISERVETVRNSSWAFINVYFFVFVTFFKRGLERNCKSKTILEFRKMVRLFFDKTIV